MNGFTYTLTLLEPVLANSLGGDPNSANSLFYIPGGLVRGAAINAYKGGEKEAGDDAFRRLFLDGRVRFLNAYPISENGRALPTPLQYKKQKYFAGGDLSTIKDNKIHAIEEVWQINVHTQRDAEAGHAKEKAGAVYRYISLPSGLILEGAVLTDDQTDADQIKKLLIEAETILLGKARTAGYGKAKIDIKDLELNEINKNMSGNLNEFTLTLLSPAIVRDENGQPTLDITTALKTRLGVEVKIIKASRHSDVVGGFNRTWGLPLPQVTAIAAGSVFKVTGSIEADKLVNLQETGIGERRAEGFGRVMVNQELPTIAKDDPWPVPVKPIMDEGKKSNNLTKNDTATLMVTRLARRDLDEKVVHIARQITEDYMSKENKVMVPNSQLSRWRIVIRNVLDRKDANGKRNVQPLKNFLTESKDKTGWKKMEKARIKPGGTPQRLTEWIKEWLEKPEKLKDVLKPNFDQRFILGENSFQFSDELNFEYRLRLLDAVLAVMAKKNGGSND